MPQWWQIENKMWIDRGIENAPDDWNLNAQEVSVVDIFAESYNPTIPAGWWQAWSWQSDDDDDTQNVKQKLENQIKVRKDFLKNNIAK